MPAFLFGLPTHPLVVHAVVVLVPLAVLGCIAAAALPRLRRRIAWPLVALTAVGVAAIPLATGTGEDLEHNLPRTAAIATHAELGDELLVWAAAMLVGILALVLLDRRRRSDRRPLLRYLSAGLAAATVVLAVVSAVQVVRIGDSGARAAWGSVQYSPQPRPAGPNG